MGQTANTDPELLAQLKKYRLSQDEHRRIVGLMGREPRGVEWALFSALWSEHCSYKSSKVHLKKLYSKGERVLQSFGENAGVVDLGEGERIAFKIESHNHPSFIEPYQGAATGVGGILRDIFTMGARPIALANYLCFGEAKADRMQTLVDGVVRGIGGYGNSVGVPMLTGQTEFHSAYNQNILVNAMAVGLFRKGEKVFLSQARGPGNLVVYAGSKTGRDGVHGASMASESFGEDSKAKRPTVQIGDPFFEKLLIEACLEVMAEDLVVAIQDMGAAGLTSSSFEMAAKGKVGFRLDLDRVPLRDATLTAEDILLSESQERMLMVVEPHKLKKVVGIFERWGLDACAIGEVLSTPEVELYFRGELLTRIDPELLVEHCPRYDRPYREHVASAFVDQKTFRSLPRNDSSPDLKTALQSIENCSRTQIYEQFDQHVGASTVSGCDEQVGVVLLPDSKRPLGIALGCRPSVMGLDAFLGGLDSVMRPALSLIAKGLEPIAVTDCLNFASPERIEVMSGFVAALKGLNLACEALRTPIISGNVSFYNETEGRGILPTPAIGMVGLGTEVSGLPKSCFQTSGSNVYLLSSAQIETDFKNFTSVASPEFEPQAHVASWTQFGQSLMTFVRLAQKQQLVRSTRVVGKGGVARALAVMTLNHRIGLAAQEQFSPNETFYQVIVESTLDRDAFSALWTEARGDSSAVRWLGRTGGSKVQLSGSNVDVEDLMRLYQNGWSVIQ